MIERICTFCEVELGPPVESDDETLQVSHGICAECLGEFVAACGQTMESFLDELSVPVFVVNHDARIFHANEHARNFLSKSSREIDGCLGGEVFGCVHASKPEGCGGTIHCKSCTVRQTVVKTFFTGEPSLRVPAFSDLARFDGVRRIRFLLSTQKVGPVVVLRIEDLV